MTILMESGYFLPALAKYKQAIAVMENTPRASTRSDQRELELNRAKCLMNLAATSMATHSYGDAVRTVKYTFEILEPRNKHDKSEVS